MLYMRSRKPCIEDIDAHFTYCITVKGDWLIRPKAMHRRAGAILLRACALLEEQVGETTAGRTYQWMFITEQGEEG